MNLKDFIEKPDRIVERLLCDRARKRPLPSDRSELSIKPGERLPDLAAGFQIAGRSGFRSGEFFWSLGIA
jgi:hypothetical protein